MKNCHLVCAGAVPIVPEDAQQERDDDALSVGLPAESTDGILSEDLPLTEREAHTLAKYEPPPSEDELAFA